MKIAAAMPADAGVVEFVVREQLPEPLERQPCDVRRTQFLVTGDHVLERAFKVPSLRGVSERAPHMHAGQFDTLTEVVDHYNRAPKVVRDPDCRSYGTLTRTRSPQCGRSPEHRNTRATAAAASRRE